MLRARFCRSALPVRCARFVSGATTEAQLQRTVYVGPLAGTARTLKRFSIGSLALSILASPLLLTLDAPSIALEPRLVMVAGAVGFSAVSTGLVHWMLHPYVTRISLLGYPEPDSKVYDAAEVTADSELMLASLTFFGGRKETRVRLGSLSSDPIQRMFAVWHDKGNARRWYLHEGLVQTQEMEKMVSLVEQNR